MLQGSTGGHLAQVSCLSSHLQLPQMWRLHNLPCWPVPVLTHSLSEKVSYDIQINPSVFQCVSINFWPTHWASLKRGWLHALCTLSSGIYIHGENPSALYFLKTEQSQLSVFSHGEILFLLVLYIIYHLYYAPKKQHQHNIFWYLESLVYKTQIHPNSLLKCLY